jgi:glyoxylase-like metal-dependent hydrolase (beta-lactamase superfamily II)
MLAAQSPHALRRAAVARGGLHAMTARIHAMPIGFDTVYAVVDAGTILVDGGQPGKSHLIARRFADAGLATDQVRLIVITHGHWDHIGCAAALARATGAPIAMHESEAERLERGVKVMPRGRTAWGHVMGVFVRPMMWAVRIEATPVAVPVGDDGLSLEPYGVAGRAIHTPGHSPGSLSVVLEGGDALVGDLAMNWFPLRVRPGLPIFAEQPERLKASVERLLAAGATTIHPAHGPAFPASVLERAIARL